MLLFHSARDEQWVSKTIGICSGKAGQLVRTGVWRSANMWPHVLPEFCMSCGGASEAAGLSQATKHALSQGHPPICLWLSEARQVPTGTFPLDRNNLHVQVAPLLLIASCSAYKERRGRFYDVHKQFRSRLRNLLLFGWIVSGVGASLMNEAKCDTMR